MFTKVLFFFGLLLFDDEFTLLLFFGKLEGEYCSYISCDLCLLNSISFANIEFINTVPFLDASFSFFDFVFDV